MQPSSHERNRRAFEDPDTVAFYADDHELTPAETRLFEGYVPPDSDVLDLGVGAGRTTPYLSDKARSYVGVDYAAAMVEACRDRFPHLPFHEADASDLGRFDDQSFDVVVFSFNGIDYISPAQRRERCLAECRRVLRPGGVLILSRHNPRAIVRLPSPGTIRGRSLARAARSVAAVPLWTLRRTVRMAVHGGRTFWSGEGTIVEPLRGFNAPLRSTAATGATGQGTAGMLTHMATPRRVREELARHGLDVVAVVGSRFPAYSGILVTPWYYYAATKDGRSGESGSGQASR